MALYEHIESFAIYVFLVMVENTKNSCVLRKGQAQVTNLWDNAPATFPQTVYDFGRRRLIFKFLLPFSS